MAPGAIVTPTTAHQALLSHNYREMNHWYAVSGSWPKGQRSAGFMDKFQGAVRYITTPVGANKIFEVVESFIIHPNLLTGGMFTRPILFSMVLNAGNGSPSIVGESVQGIEIGSFMTNPPWNTTYSISAGGPVLQLRWNYVLERWEVLVWDADAGLAPDVYACDYQPGFTVDTGIIEATLQWLPSTTGDSVLNAYLGGILAKSLSGGRLNGLATAEPNGCGYFISNGSAATAKWEEAGFYSGRIYEPYTR